MCSLKSGSTQVMHSKHLKFPVYTATCKGRTAIRSIHSKNVKFNSFPVFIVTMPDTKNSKNSHYSLQENLLSFCHEQLASVFLAAIWSEKNGDDMGPGYSPTYAKSLVDPCGIWAKGEQPTLYYTADLFNQHSAAQKGMASYSPAIPLK